MLLEFAADIFGGEDTQDAFLVVQLIRFTIERRHDWFPRPDLLDTASGYLDKNFPTMPGWHEFVRNAAKAAVWRGAANPRPAVRVTAENLDLLASDLSKPAVVVVENGRNDGSFLKAVFAAYAPELANALNLDWLQIHHAGGTGEQIHVAEDSASRFKAICRVIVVKDNDRRLPDPEAGQEPDAWPPAKPYVHTWRRLEVENYLPDAVLHESKHPDAHTLVFHLRAMTPEQQRWIDMKHGLARSGPPNLFIDVDAVTRRVWQSGFTKHFPKPLVPDRLTLTVDDFRRLGEDVHEELLRLTNRIRLVA
jgi:hypothetical protein